MGKKQVVFIMTDTQRTDLVSCYEDKGVKTPNIDKLAAEGIKYTKAYTCQPVCGPARSAIFTGTFPHSNGAWANSMPIYENTVTIGRRLSDKGIECGYIGKWHLDGGDYYGNGVCPQGWNERYWYDMRCYLEEKTNDERVNSRRQNYSSEVDLEPEFCYGRRVSDKAFDYLDEYCNDDFFLVVSYDEPHHPYLTPPPFNRMYNDYVFPNSPNLADTLEDKPEHQQFWAGANVERDPAAMVQKYPEYFNCIAFVDDEIGRVVRKVKEVAPDALIIFTSDHGDMLESHCLTGKGPVAYEEVLHIPLIIAGGPLHEAQEYTMPVSHIDLTPTICDYFSLPQSLVFEGKSLLPTLDNVDLRVNDYIFSEFGRFEIDHDFYGGFQAMRVALNERYKLVINLLTSDEFYDLEKDPYEMVNLINSEEYTQIREEMHDQLIEWMNRTRDPFRGYYWQRRPWRKDGAKNANWAFTGFTRQRFNLEYEPQQLSYEDALPVDPENAVRRKSMWYGKWRDKTYANLFEDTAKKNK